MEYISKAISILTRGIVNVQRDSIVFKDPFTGIYDLFKEGVDMIFRDKNKGVWIGTRPINGIGVGFSSAFLRFLNLDGVHQAVMIDGRVFSLANDKGGRIYIKEIYSEYEKSQYNWRYKGKTVRRIDQLVKKVNNHQISYNLAFANCQDVSDALIKYALSVYSEEDSIQLIFPKIRSVPEGIAMGLGGRVILRFISDIFSFFFQW